MKGCYKNVPLMLILLVLLCITDLFAQVAPPIGIRQNTPTVHAFTNARMIVAPGKVIEKGTMVIRNGLIVAIGASVPIPADARIWDMSGTTLYPGLIESYSDIGMPKKPQPLPGQEFRQTFPVDLSERRGLKHWNDHVMSALNADELFLPDPKATEKLREIGFTTSLVVPQKGIFRGTSALFNLGDGTPGRLLIQSRVAHHVTCEAASGGDEYPNSLMGVVALIRQTFLDARWHRSVMQAAAQYPNEPRPESMADLAALEDAAAGQQPVVFETTDELGFLRAAQIAKEFSLTSWVRGSGYEYRRLDAVKQTGLPVILPVNFPDPPSVQTPEEALNVSLQELCYWDEAPENPKRLQEAGIPFTLTTATLKDPGNFLGNVRTAVERGLPAEAALAALTTSPAKLFGVEKRIGTLEVGKIANFIVTDGDLFARKTEIRETWIDGRRYPVKPRPDYDPRGTWQAVLTSAPIETLSVVLGGKVEKLYGSVMTRGKEIQLMTATFSEMRLTLAFSGDSLFLSGILRMTGVAGGDMMLGTGERADGIPFTWTAIRKAPFAPEPDTLKPQPPALASFGPVYPPGEFGRRQLPDLPVHTLVRGATIWTSGPQGTLENGDMLVERGKILKVGSHLEAPPDALVVDAQGKHVTPGIVDCHSHSAMLGRVDEGGQAITAEVRVEDVLNVDDISLYRQLSGGVTTTNLLHGSDDPIGGQNQVIKLRWGATPEEMKFEGAMPGIKFALGENVKQDNWEERYGTRPPPARYPQTRQGVEQIIRDEFQAAREYERMWKDFESGKRKIPPRRDLQAEAVLEILKGKRLIHAHSYRQDEILMLLRLAEEFGFQIGTFQHVLEGYKVADQLARHGAGASAFSDWWAYKFEVYDAIPYNGALMHDAGVLVSFNSDSDEFARRLNTEAAKAVKYGGVPPEEALKFVTINPAKQLRIDHRVGSLEPGKDADFVVWSGYPLSSYTICEQTWIDGRRYFDREEDRRLNEEIQKKRTTLIQKILVAKKEER